MGIKLNVKDIEPKNIELQEKIEMQEAADYFKESAAKHKQNAKEMRKIFLTTGIIVLALAVIFFAIMAWFANNKNTSGSGANLMAKADIIIISNYSVYYTDSTSGTTLYKRALMSEGKDIKMPDYDAAIYENKNTQVYFKLPVISNTEFSPEDNYLMVTVGRNPNAEWKTIDQTGNFFMSSILEVKSGPVAALQGTDDDLPDSDANAQEIYTKAQAAFTSRTGQTFVNKTNPGAQGAYQESLTFLVNDFKVYEYQEDGKTMYKTYVYIEMNYCPDLVKKLYKIDDTHAGDIGTNAYKTQFLHDNAKLAVSINDN